MNPIATITGNVILKKNIVTFSIIKIILNNDTPSSYLFHYLKSFNLKHILFMFTIFSEYIYCIISTVQTAVSMRYKTFSLKISKLPTFSEITYIKISKCRGKCTKYLKMWHRMLYKTKQYLYIRDHTGTVMK